MNYELNNGLRIVHLPSTSPVVYCGIGINAGSRQEAPGEEGLAHFCEHVTFKGTRRRSAIQILNCLESVGGDLNAFTNKEDTVFYAAVQKEHFPKAVDLLTDIVFCSQFPEQEIQHEVDVICDEIESYNDSPAELIYDEFENLLFQHHPLGHNILGTRERVQSFTSADARRFTLYGDIDFSRVVKMLETLGTLPRQTLLQSLPVREGSGCSQDSTPLPHREGQGEGLHHQSHVMIGSQAYSYNDERRLPLYLLNNILGGPGMNAHLNLSLRERHGLVYTVESSMASYSDTGAWSVYFGCDHHDVQRCLRLVKRELDRFMQSPLSDRQLTAAKRQLKGQLTIACDNREQFALDVAKHFLHDGRELTVDTLLQQIDAITSAQIQQVAQELFDPSRLKQLVL